MSDLFKTIINKHSEKEICERVDELKPEFVHDWEDEFDDIHEAYDEQGRGEAESQVITEAIKSVANNLHATEFIPLFDQLAEHWNLSTN